MRKVLKERPEQFRLPQAADTEEPRDYEPSIRTPFMLVVFDNEPRAICRAPSVESDEMTASRAIRVTPNYAKKTLDKVY